MGNKTSIQSPAAATAPTNILIELNKEETQFQPGDVVRGNVCVTTTVGSSDCVGYSDDDDSHQMVQDAFRSKYAGVTITVTGVEYAYDDTKNCLVVIDTFKLGVNIDLSQPPVEPQHEQNYLTSNVGAHETTSQTQGRRRETQVLLQQSFEIELPVASSPQTEIDLNDFRPFQNTHLDDDEQHEKDDLPDAHSLGSCSESCNEDTSCDSNNKYDDDDDSSDYYDWEMISTKRHSLTRPVMVPKQYAYKVKAMLRERP